MTQKFNCFASEVKALRKKLVMSQEHLAKELGVSFATVNRWENGKTQPSKLAKNQFERFYELQKNKERYKWQVATLIVSNTMMSFWFD